MTEWKYDVAFSLLHRDREIAARLESMMHDRRCFFYRRRQEEFVGEDGLVEFSRPFRHDSQLCVVLYRPEWGTTKWTRHEEQAIKDRWLDEGHGFLLIVHLEQPGAGNRGPAWLPENILRAHFTDLGPEGVVRAIRRKLKQRASDHGPIRIAAETARREALPISFYRTLSRADRVGQQFTPTRPEVCDACRRDVRFRPLIVMTITLDGWTNRDQFCPPCARDRGITVMRIPGGPTEEELFAGTNPTLRRHLDRLLKRQDRAVLRSIGGNEIVRNRGILNVGASLSAQGLMLIVRTKEGTSETPLLPLSELEAADALTVPALAQFLTDYLMRCLDDADAYPLRRWERPGRV